MMRGLEIGRIQVACRALGVGRAALEDSLRYAQQQRESFGQPIWQHQSVGNYLADMATKWRPPGSWSCTRRAVRLRCPRRPGGRHGEAVRLGDRDGDRAQRRPDSRPAYGYSTEFDVERYFRDAPPDDPG